MKTKKKYYVLNIKHYLIILFNLKSIFLMASFLKLKNMLRLE